MPNNLKMFLDHSDLTKIVYNQYYYIVHFNDMDDQLIEPRISGFTLGKAVLDTGPKGWQIRHSDWYAKFMSGGIVLTSMSPDTDLVKVIESL